MSDRFPSDDEHLHPYPGNLKQHKVMTPDAHSRSYLSALNDDADDAYANKHEPTPKFSVVDASKYVNPNTKKMMDDFIKRMNMSLGEAALLGFEQGKKEASLQIGRQTFSSECECCVWVHANLPILLPAERHGKLVYPFKSERCQREVGRILGQKLWEHLTSKNAR